MLRLVCSQLCGSSVRNCVDNIRKNAIISVDRVEKLEIEIKKLKEQLSSTPSSLSLSFKQMSALSINKDEVANKCMSIIVFTNEKPNARHTRIESLMSESLSQFEWVNIDSIVSEPFADRKQTKIGYIEFNSNSDCDAALKFIGDNDIKF